MPFPLTSVAVLREVRGDTQWVEEIHTDTTGDTHNIEVTYPVGIPIDRDLAYHAEQLARSLAWEESLPENQVEGILLVQHQTLEEFCGLLMGHYYNSSDTSFVKLARWLVSLLHTDPPLVQDEFIINVLQITPEKWAEVKDYAARIVDAENLLKTARGT